MLVRYILWPCLSTQVDVHLSKRLSLSLCNYRQIIASDLKYSGSKKFHEIPMGVPLRLAPNGGFQHLTLEFESHIASICCIAIWTIKLIHEQGPWQIHNTSNQKSWSIAATKLCPSSCGVIRLDLTSRCSWDPLIIMMLYFLTWRTRGWSTWPANSLREYGLWK